MNLKLNVAIALGIFIFVAGNIILFGSSNRLFPFAYLFFTFFFLVFAAWTIESIEGKTFVITIILAVFVAIAATFCAYNFKIYLDSTSNIGSQDLVGIESMIQTNNQYIAYVNSTASTIKNLQANSALTQQQIIQYMRLQQQIEQYAQAQAALQDTSVVAVDNSASQQLNNTQTTPNKPQRREQDD
jgi:uncharacterized membrane protein